MSAAEAPGKVIGDALARLAAETAPDRIPLRARGARHAR